MKEMYKTFSGRLTRRVMLAVFVTMIIITFIILSISFQAIMEEAEGRYMDRMDVVSEKLGRILLHKEICARNVFDEVLENLDSPESVMRTMEKEIKFNDYTDGYFVAFEPGYFPKYPKWFEPYMGIHDVKIRDIGSASHDYLSKTWYIRTKNEKNGFWTDPYYDGIGAQDNVCTFCMPLYDSKGRLAGVSGSVMTLKWLMSQLQENDAYFHTFIVTGKGTYVSHPDENRILKDNVRSHIAPDDTDALNDILQMKRGQTTMTIDGVRSLVYYAPLESVNWAMGIVVPQSAIWIPTLMMIGLLFIITIIGLIVVYYFCRHSIRQISKPLSALAKSADIVAEGNFHAPLPVIEYKDEICMLRDSFAAMQRSLSQYMIDLKETTAEKASIDSDLRIANGIQMGMLPKVFPTKDDCEDVQLYASLTPAKAVGGDLFDFFFRDEKLFFCIGDVSGKGVSASLFMAVTRAVFRTVSARDSVPSRIMENLNNIIIGFSDTNMFVTLFIGVLDLPTGTLHYCNAGHDIPLLVGAGVGKLPCDSNIPVGFMPQWKYSLQEARIFTGTTIFLYTDGLTEAEDINHAQFKNKRVIEVAEKALSLQQHEPRQLIDMMTDAVHQFVGDAEQSDDLTMMAIQYIRQERDVKFSKRIVLTNDIKQLTQLTAFVQEVCEQLGFNENLTKKMNLAIEEAVTNVIFYAYPRGIKGDISIEAVSNDVRLKFTIIDSGSPFDPTMKGEADITSSLEDRPIGGLGIHLMRKIMDSINYERIDGHNVLTLRKKLNT